MEVQAIIKIARIEGASKDTIKWFNKNTVKKEDEQGKQFNIFCVESLADDLAGEYLQRPAHWTYRQIKEITTLANRYSCDWVELIPASHV